MPWRARGAYGGPAGSNSDAGASANSSAAAYDRANSRTETYSHATNTCAANGDACAFADG